MAPMAQVGPLFGPQGERSWAGPHWDPVFQFPLPAQDVEGAVFTLRHGSHNVVWVNTVFDLKVGHIQYVYFIPDNLVTTVDVRLKSQAGASGGEETKVDVIYTRTALSASVNQDVLEMGEDDRQSDAEWYDVLAKVIEGH